MRQWRIDVVHYSQRDMECMHCSHYIHCNTFHPLECIVMHYNVMYALQSLHPSQYLPSLHDFDSMHSILGNRHPSQVTPSCVYVCVSQVTPSWLWLHPLHSLHSLHSSHHIHHITFIKIFHRHLIFTYAHIHTDTHVHTDTHIHTWGSHLRGLTHTR